MVFKVQLADERGVSADHHHGQQIGHHGDVDQPQHAEHELGFFQGVNVHDHFPELDEKFIGVQELGDDQAAIQRSLNPTAGKHDGFEAVFEGVGGVRDGCDDVLIRHDAPVSVNRRQWMEGPDGSRILERLTACVNLRRKESSA